MPKVIIARVTSGLASEMLDIFNKFKKLVSAHQGDLLSDSFSADNQKDGFTAILGFKDPKNAEAIFKHNIRNAEIRVIGADLDADQHRDLEEVTTPLPIVRQ